MLTTLKTIKTLPTLPEGRTYLVVAEQDEQACLDLAGDAIVDRDARGGPFAFYLPGVPRATYMPFPAWGRDRDITTAIKNCKANFPRIYGGEWRFRVYDAPGDTTIDSFGHSYTKSDKKAVEVARYKLTAADLEA